ncbi:hypothetical protein QFZ33_002279 [Arthrobacter globiformis]|nr:hypothetical protein [Arthrobacter globiformis]
MLCGANWVRNNLTPRMPFLGPIRKAQLAVLRSIAMSEARTPGETASSTAEPRAKPAGSPSKPCTEASARTSFTCITSSRFPSSGRITDSTRFKTLFPCVRTAMPWRIGALVHQEVLPNSKPLSKVTLAVQRVVRDEPKAPRASCQARFRTSYTSENTALGIGFHPRKPVCAGWTSSGEFQGELAISSASHIGTGCNEYSSWVGQFASCSPASGPLGILFVQLLAPSIAI